MESLYKKYYQLCLMQRECVAQGDNQALAENIEKKEQLINEIKQLKQPVTDELRPLLERIAMIEKQNMKNATHLLNERRKQAMKIDKNRHQINQYL